MKREPQKISLVISDVDGTLVTRDQVLTARTRDAVHKLQDAGILFGLTSGRPPRGMQMLVEPLNLKSPLAGFNGGFCVRPDMSAIKEYLLPSDLARRVAEFIESHDLDVWVYNERAWYVQSRHGSYVDREECTVQFPPKVATDDEDALDKAIKIVGVSDDYDAVASTEMDLQQEFGTEISASRSQPYYLDVTHPLANKGMVIETFAQELNVPTSEIATIGDGPNDVLMFQKCGMSIAMGNASKAVQKAAQYVTTSFEDEGFARAVEQFLLTRRGFND